MKRIFVVSILMMAMTIPAFCADLYETIKGSYFQVQVRYYVNAAAVAVKNEDPLTPNHDARAIFADKILNGNAPFYEMSLSVAGNATIKTKIEADQDYDSDMAFVVSSIYDAYAVPYTSPE